MMINSLLFESYLECPTKCWLRSRAQPVTGNTYAEWARAKNEAYFHDSLKSLLATLPEGDHEFTSRISKHPGDATRRFAIDVSLRANDVEARLQAVERMPPDGRDRPAKFIPYRFTFSNKVAKNDKLSLAFDALVLSKALDCELSIGKIVHGDTRATLKIALSPLIVEVQKRIKNVAALVADSSPPDLVLNRHCPQCEFEARCRGQAVERDELSLLSGMPEKERRKLRSKGIFTVTQLSHMFRPRRRRWEVRGKKERFHHSLRALAIREKKIHAVDLPGQIFDGTPVYLDVEGLPDRNSYYLIGARVATSTGAIQYTFWADDEGDEKRIWTDFLRILLSIPDPQLVHYGSYETTFLRQMCDRYGGPQEGSASAAAVKRAVNLLSFVFARIYFPTFSNGLKDVAGYLGFQWSGSPSSGLEAIVWRHG
jgi:predicted RecB family nuclease